jgi:hypothetical protein
MAETKKSQGQQDSLTTILERGAQEPQSSRRQKRLAQHQHWMRVMMEGQATPDLTYQKPKV